MMEIVTSFFSFMKVEIISNDYEAGGKWGARVQFRE